MASSSKRRMSFPQLQFKFDCRDLKCEFVQDHVECDAVAVSVSECGRDVDHAIARDELHHRVLQRLGIASNILTGSSHVLCR